MKVEGKWNDMPSRSKGIAMDVKPLIARRERSHAGLDRTQESILGHTALGMPANAIMCICVMLYLPACHLPRPRWSSP